MRIAAKSPRLLRRGDFTVTVTGSSSSRNLEMSMSWTAVSFNAISLA
jgi:hypothetical protein